MNAPTVLGIFASSNLSLSLVSHILARGRSVFTELGLRSLPQHVASVDGNVEDLGVRLINETNWYFKLHRGFATGYQLDEQPYERTETLRLLFLAEVKMSLAVVKPFISRAPASFERYFPKYAAAAPRNLCGAKS